MVAPLFLPRRRADGFQSFGGRIDQLNPLARGLLVVVDPAQRFDLISGKQFTQEGTFATAASPAGVGLVTNGTNSDIFLSIPQVVLTKFCVFGVFKSNSNGADCRAMGFGSSLNTNPILAIDAGTNSAAKVRVYVRDDATGGTGQDSAASAFDGTLHAVALDYDGANLRCYIDGKLDTTIANAGLTFTVDRFCIGALYRSSAAAWWAGTTFFGSAWNRSLSADEHARLTGDPRQLIRPQQRAPLYLASGGAAALAGSATTTATASGVLSTAIPLAGSAGATAAAGGALSTSIALSGTAIAAVSAAGALSTSIRLTGAASASAVASGALSTGIPLSGVASASAIGAGALSTGIALSGVAAVASIATGALTAPGASLSGSASVSAVASGSLTTSIRLAGSASVTTSASGSLAGSGAALSGAAACGSSAAGALTTGIALVGSSGASVFAAGALATAIRLAGSATASASASASFDQAPPYISPARTVIFEGLGATTTFDGFRTTVAFEGQTTLVRFQ